MEAVTPVEEMAVPKSAEDMLEFIKSGLHSDWSVSMSLEQKEHLERLVVCYMLAVEQGGAYKNFVVQQLDMLWDKKVKVRGEE